jgi:hypothetical protein
MKRGTSELGAEVSSSPIVAAVIEDRGDRPSRGEPGSGAVPPGAPHYPEWPSAGHPPDAGEQPTDIYAALSDLAPGDLAPDDSAPVAGHGQPVPRDFVPPQVTWTPSPEPEYYDGSRIHWTEPGIGSAPVVPIERFEQRREDWRPAYRLPEHRLPEPHLPKQRLPEQGFPEQRLPEQGFPEQGLPEQSFPEQGYPEPRGDEQSLQVGQLPRIEWASAAETEVFGEPMIDLSAPRPLPATHRGRRRHTRTVVAVAALGAVLAGATGYVLLRGLGLSPTTRTDASVPIVTATPADPSVAADAPADTFSIPPSASERQSTSASPHPSATTTKAASATGTPVQGTNPSLVAPVAPPTATVSPLSTHPAPTATASKPAAPLTASLRSGQSNGGYLGTVTVTNPGDAAVSDWTVRVDAPGASQVTVVGSGVSLTRSGDELVFTPASGAAPIAAGGSLTYAFAIAGSLSVLPSGCEINGSPCS